MASNTIKYDDTTNAFATPTQDGPSRVKYPFKNNPVADSFARSVERDFKQISTPALADVNHVQTRLSYSNNLTYSNDFSNAAWTKTGTTISGSPPSPWDGSVQGGFLTEDSGTSEHSMSQSANLIALPQVVWCIIKTGVQSSKYIYLKVTDSAATVKEVWFNAATSTLSTSFGTLGTDSFCETLPPTYYGDLQGYRIGFKFTPASGAATVKIGLSKNGSSTSYLGTGMSFAVSHVQLEAIGTNLIGALVQTTSAVATVSCPEVDALANLTGDNRDPFAFLVGETDPEPSLASIVSYTKRYSRIPYNQVLPSSRYIDRPILHDIKSGSNYAVSFGDQKLSHIWTSRKTVSSLAALAASTVVTTPSAATFSHDLITIKEATYAAQTFYADDSDATILAALSLAIYNDGAHNSYTYFPILRNSNDVTISSTAGPLTITVLSSGGATTEVSLASGVVLGVAHTYPDEMFSFSTRDSASSTTATESIDASIRTVTATGHGGAVGDLVAFWTGDRVYATGVVLTVPTADTFTVSLDTLPGKDATVTHCAFSSDANYCVVNGPKMCSLRLTQRFYLPGYTTGITTAADITPPATATDPISWLAAIVAGTSWLVDSVTDLKSWDGPILVQESSEVQMSDAIDTVTP